MRRHGSISALRWIALVFIFAAAVLTVLQLINFSRVRGSFPLGLSIAGVPVGGLDRQQAAQRLLHMYAVPIELHYGTGVVQIKPSTLGFELDLESMLAAAELQRVNQPFWLDFWNTLWNRNEVPTKIPLLASISEDRLRKYLLEEIASRYDSPPSAAIPIPGSTSFQAGQAGTALNVDRAVSIIEDALHSPTHRVVNLSYDRTTPPRPAFQNLQVMLKQILTVNQFDGLAELYLLDLQTQQEIHFVYQSGEGPIPPPDIAFSAESTIKIPIMVSVFRRIQDTLPEELANPNQLDLMMDQSENPPADVLMRKLLDPGRGPLMVTEDMRAIGLQNTFLGAFMSEPIFLAHYDTPANQRKDVTTDPDQYNQTTAMDIGMLLNDIYQCATEDGGALIAAFNGEITQSECQTMINTMSKNKIGVLFQAGLPEGTRFAHKHAWAITNDRLIHTFGDAGIAYTQGGNYIISGFMYSPTSLVFDPTNQLFSQLSTAIYNYYNQVQ
ncbi:MAG: serine hydrolase [Anaerolineaceae bacterium]|nr:serine hydrolase [Anaerolineaceae bacterium]